MSEDERAEDFDVELSDDEPDEYRGLFVVFGLGEGRTLQLHVPSAKGVMIGGHSKATELSYFVVSTDGSIETSGPMILVGAAEDLNEGT